MPAAYQFPLQLRFGDVDSYGHVNNVRFLQFLEDARVHWLREPLPEGVGGFGSASGRGGGTESTMFDYVTAENFTLVGRHEIEYLAPLLYRPAPIAVNLWMTRLGGSSFDLGYSVAEPDGSAIYAYASTSMVLVSRSTGLPVRLPAGLREAFGHYSGPAVPFRRRPPLPAEVTAGAPGAATAGTSANGGAA
ncbi:acyl-CoA thioesterase [Sinomonas terrae]|uniref:Acyl-CoA thioesterase n=1 Tax=Sinomonas terrae TaxID=2908838 RepID=A0ABS9TZY0_9MICC|nr:thioesterase family protein [Sinomonas terrae]MCH6469986.1 acyl-CoA thioesterase [Sinomonas terrae]